jgi:hypothetical protein
MQAWEQEGDFGELVSRDPEIQRLLGEEGLERVFSVERQLRNVASIFGRVFS